MLSLHSFEQRSGCPDWSNGGVDWPTLFVGVKVIGLQISFIL